MQQDLYSKRLGIFAFYDKDGIVDDYVVYLLRDLLENLTDLVVVVNGDLTEAGREKLTSLTNQIVVRKNKGYDFGAWKHALTTYLGWDRVCAYDELVLVNNTFFGPFYPFKRVFEAMDERNVDFWGLTAHGDCELGNIELFPPKGYIPHHIQSFFYVFRKSVIVSKSFEHFWEKLPETNSHRDAVLFGETALTCYLENAGFCWSVYVDCSDLDEHTNISLRTAYCMWTPHLLLERGLPIMKAGCFGISKERYRLVHNNEEVRESLRFIREKTGYDDRMIFQNILRRFPIADIHDTACLNYVLPTNTAMQPVAEKPSRTLVVIHLYFMDLLQEELPYFHAIPDYMDVLITTTDADKRAIIEQTIRPILGDRLRMAVMAQNRGRDIAALLVLARPYIQGYEYVCFCKDKKTSAAPALLGRSFAQHGWVNMLAGETYIQNIIGTFLREPCLGLLVPPPYTGGCLHAEYNHSLFWAGNFHQTVALARELGVHVPISPNKMILTIGTYFWARTAALAPLLEHAFQYEDFPEEPMPPDGALGHAVERVLAFVAQQKGYYTGWVMTAGTASSLVNNEFVQKMPIGVRGAMPIGVRGALKNYIKKHIPASAADFINKHTPLKQRLPQQTRDAHYAKVKSHA